MSKPIEEVVLSAIRQIEAATTDHGVLQILADFVSPFGFDSVSLGHIVNPAHVDLQSKDWFVLSTWSDELQVRYRERQAMFFDPVARYALNSRRPFLWSDAYKLAGQKGQSWLDEVGEAGLKQGLSIPVHDIGKPAGCISFSGEQSDLSPTERSAIELVALHAYSKLEPVPNTVDGDDNPLTEREEEILHYLAAGKSNKAIACALNISQFTVRQHASEIMRKLETENRTVLAAFAISRGLTLPL